MRTGRLAIICVCDEDAAATNEVRGSGTALYERYVKIRLPKPLDTAGKVTAWAVNPNNALLVIVPPLNINLDPEHHKIHEGANYKNKSEGNLGVYIVVHGMKGTIAGVEPETIVKLIEDLGLKDVSKLAFLTSALAKDTDFVSGTEAKDRTYLYKICECLAKNGIKPKMAGWTNLITVVYLGMDNHANDDAVKKKVLSEGKEINYVKETGRKAVIRGGAKEDPNRDQLSLMTKERRKRQKLCYVYRDGGVG
jgi:hypothetical protein